MVGSRRTVGRLDRQGALIVPALPHGLHLGQSRTPPRRDPFYAIASAKTIRSWAGFSIGLRCCCRMRCGLTTKRDWRHQRCVEEQSSPPYCNALQSYCSTIYHRRMERMWKGDTGILIRFNCLSKRNTEKTMLGSLAHLNM